MQGVKDEPKAPADTKAADTPPAATGLQPATSAPLTTTSGPSKAPVRLGIAPQTLDEGWRLAQMIARSELVPKNFRGKPEEVLVAIQMGIEIGLAPMQALQSIAVINGRPSVWGDGFLALIMSSGVYADHDEFYEVDGQRKDGLTAEDLKKDSTAGVCTFARRGKATPVTRRFTVGQAKKANLLGKEGPWQSYPDRMLLLRARGFAGRDAFADILRGIRTAEEAFDTPDDEVEVETTPAPPVRRISETQAPAVETTTPAADLQRVTLGPFTVKDVQPFLGGYCVTVGGGQQIDVTNEEDALELERCKGTAHRFLFECAKAGDGLSLTSWRIAD
jgi:hypothetical protein